MLPTGSKHGPDMAPKSRQSNLKKPYLPSLENFRALAGLEEKLGQTWSQHGTNKVPKIDLPYTWALDHVDLNLKILEV